MSGLVVVDASLAFKWLVKEEHSDEALAIAQYWNSQDVTPTAPHLMPVEVANALYKRVVRGELTVEAAKRRINSLISSGIELREALELHGRALELAHELQQGAVYDAHYLALSESLDCELWTADEKFFRAASPMAENVRWIGEFVPPTSSGPQRLVRNSMNGPALRQESAYASMKSGSQASSSVNWVAATKSLRFRSPIMGWPGS